MECPNGCVAKVLWDVVDPAEDKLQMSCFDCGHEWVASLLTPAMIEAVTVADAWLTETKELIESEMQHQSRKPTVAEGFQINMANNLRVAFADILKGESNE
ncbi:MAG: hypothetical protein GY841_04285 [FCB group bacterium]|nr:hypothetical protein [FCB group bacterium]